MRTARHSGRMAVRMRVGVDVPMGVMAVNVGVVAMIVPVAVTVTMRVIVVIVAKRQHRRHPLRRSLAHQGIRKHQGHDGQARPREKTVAIRAMVHRRGQLPSPQRVERHTGRDGQTEHHAGECDRNLSAVQLGQRGEGGDVGRRTRHQERNRCPGRDTRPHKSRSQRRRTGRTNVDRNPGRREQEDLRR